MRRSRSFCRCSKDEQSHLVPHRLLSSKLARATDASTPLFGTHSPELRLGGSLLFGAKFDVRPSGRGQVTVTQVSDILGWSLCADLLIFVTTEARHPAKHQAVITVTKPYGIEAIRQGLEQALSNTDPSGTR